MRRLIPIISSRGYPTSSIASQQVLPTNVSNKKSASNNYYNDNQHRTKIKHNPQTIWWSSFSHDSSNTTNDKETSSSSNGRSKNSSSRERIRMDDETTGKDVDTSTNGRPRSPYLILKLKTSATKDDIKSSFRKVGDLCSQFCVCCHLYCTFLLMTLPLGICHIIINHHSYTTISYLLI